MPRAKKSKVEGAGPSRSAGGRPRKRPAESPPEEPPPQPPDALPAKAQETTCSAEPAASEPESSLPPQPLELPPWKPTPTDPPMFPDPRARWRYARPISNDRVPSAIKMPRFLSRRQVEQKVELQRRYPYNNGICTCENGGLPSSGDDADHSMFCQLYKCYACEIGCCEGRVYAPKSKDDPTMTWWWDCDCIEYAFDPLYDIGGEDAELLIRSSRRHTRSHFDEHGFVDRPGGRALFCDCECGYLGGPYVPMCPFRPHGVTGLARGDMCKRLRAAWDGRGGWEWDEPPEDLSPWYAKRRVNE